MRRKYKLTGCAKFAIALLIIAPIAFLAASYFNGEDGIQNFKDLLGLDKDTSHIEEPVQNRVTDDADVADLRAIIQAQEKELQDLRKEVEELKLKLQTKGDKGEEPAATPKDSLQ